MALCLNREMSDEETGEHNSFEEEELIPNELLTCVDLPPIHQECSFKSHIVKVTHIDSPSNFFIMLQENMGYFKVYSTNLNEFYAKEKFSPTVNILPIGFYCCVSINQNWMRAKIVANLGKFRATQHAEATPFYQVRLIDNGLVANVYLDKLRFLDEQFCYDPPMVLQCLLSDVYPLTELEQFNWSMDAIETFLDLCTDQFMTAVIWSKELSLHFGVILEKLQSAKELLNDHTINELMIFSGYAKSIQIKELMEAGSLDPSLDELQKISTDTTEKKDIENTQMDIWNPMVEHHEEAETLLNDVDPERYFLGYKNEDAQNICSYIRYNKPCARGTNCPYLHIKPRSDGLPSGYEEIFCNLRCAPLRLIEGEMYRIMVLVGSSPSMFYSLLEIGDNSGMTILDELQESLTESYRHEPIKSGQTIPAHGELMVLHNKEGDMIGFYRVRVIELAQRDLGVRVKVFYIDYGKEDWVNECQLRSIFECYLYTPAQIVECYLYDVNPKNDKWDTEACDYFYSLIDDKFGTATVLSADDVAERYGIELEFDDEGINVNATLLDLGYAQSDE